MLCRDHYCYIHICRRISDFCCLVVFASLPPNLASKELRIENHAVKHFKYDSSYAGWRVDGRVLVSCGYLEVASVNHVTHRHCPLVFRRYKIVYGVGTLATLEALDEGKATADDVLTEYPLEHAYNLRLLMLVEKETTSSADVKSLFWQYDKHNFKICCEFEWF